LGESDIEELMVIVSYANEISKKHNLGYNFVVDEGRYETAIEFIDNKSYHPPLSENWDNDPVIFCPDILDYGHKVIIEYEEENGPRKPGAKLAKKGHGDKGDIETKRDSRRNEYYKLGGFKLLRIWQDDFKTNVWTLQLSEFLIQHSGI